MKDLIICGLIVLLFGLIIVALSAAVGFGLSIGWYEGARIITVNDNMAIMNRIMEHR